MTPIVVGGCTLYHADCLDVLPTLADGSVDLTVTSPPYDNLRTYNGNIADWGEHVWRRVIAELYRVTKNGGVVVWVVGDATINGSETGTSFRQALWAMECGFNLHDTMVYEKQNPVPNHSNRYQPCFEFMFVLTRGKPSIFFPMMVESGRIVGGSRQRQRDGSVAGFHSGGAAHPTKYRKNIWTYPVGTDRSGHPAVYPEALARDHILSWSNEGDTVLDPFTGSGTTGKMALLNSRKFIGIEKDAAYFDIACERIRKAAKPVQPSLLDKAL